MGARLSRTGASICESEMKIEINYSAGVIEFKICGECPSEYALLESLHQTKPTPKWKEEKYKQHIWRSIAIELPIGGTCSPFSASPILDAMSKAVARGLDAKITRKKPSKRKIRK